jgi:hypothetical protein
MSTFVHARPRRIRPPLSAVLPLVWLVSLGFLLSCGVQGPPQPPRLEVPERVAGLSVVQLGRTLEFRFALPVRARDGERLTKPLEIEILHTQLGPTKPPASTTTWAPWVRLQPDQWKPYATEGTLTYPAPLSADEFTKWQAQGSAFAVRTLTRGFRGRPLESETSNLVPLRLLDVSGPVDPLDSKTSQTAIELEWRPPAQLLDGRPVRLLAGYRVYRSLTGKPGSFRLLAETQEPLYLDRDFEFGHAYSYEVRALFKQAEIVAESEPSKPYEVIPRDVFPPARPTGLTGIYTNGAVELVWTANSEKDLAGYYVCRRQKGEPGRKLNDALLPTPILRDSSVLPGHVYFYQVTAVDLSNNESQPSAEIEVETGN